MAPPPGPFSCSLLNDAHQNPGNAMVQLPTTRYSFNPPSLPRNQYSDLKKHGPRRTATNVAIILVYLTRYPPQYHHCITSVYHTNTIRVSYQYHPSIISVSPEHHPDIEHKVATANLAPCAQSTTGIEKPKLSDNTRPAPQSTHPQMHPISVPRPSNPTIPFT
jgi:hypothetical protein